MDKVLITGANGLLGQKLVKICQGRDIPFLATSQGSNRNPNCLPAQYQSMDITDEKKVKRVIENFMPDAIIHTAAMTQVDDCEMDPETCQLINYLGTAHLYKAAIEYNIHFQLLSTDFVFDGENGPYQESDAVNPLSVYARSKVKAEQLLTQDEYDNWSIVRTILVYGTAHELSRSNFVLWSRQALKKGQTLQMVSDQFRSPTWAEDLAWACLEIIERKERGIFHISGEETKSMLEWVRSMAEHYGLPTDSVQALSSQTLNQKAKRPPRTGFIIQKAKELLNFSPTPFKRTLDLLEKELTD